MQMSSRYVRCAPNVVDDRSRDHHAERSSVLGVMLLAPRRQVRRSHRSIHCWHDHAASRSALPRERFSPLALFGPRAMSGLSPECGPKRTSANASVYGFTLSGRLVAQNSRALAVVRYCGEKSTVLVGNG